MSNGWYLLDTKWACGGVRVQDGRIVEGAPIFRKLIGQRPPSCYKYQAA